MQIMNLELKETMFHLVITLTKPLALQKVVGDEKLGDVSV